jgi:2-C-methyl-D-erythritol 4-phosphate cytidylyltransferase
MRTWVIVVAAGGGSRFGAAKQFAQLGGVTVLDRAVSVALDACDGVVVVLPADTTWNGTAGVQVAVGGATRSDSVRAGLELVPDDAEIVVVHDAARPLVTPGLIDAVVEELAAEQGAAAVIAATPVSDTIKQAGEGGEVERTLDRSGLWAVQTPQAFRAEALRDALADADSLPEATDDAMLVEQRGGRVLIHSTSPDNLKVTTPFDLRVAELLLRERA